MDRLIVDDDSIERAMQLLEKSEEDVISYIGYLEGEQDSFRHWQEMDIVVPVWDEEERWLEFTSGVERGAAKDWLVKGSHYLNELVLPRLKGAVCEKGECRKEILALESDAKDLLKYLVGLVAGLITTSAPAAAVSIGVAVAVFLLKKGLTNFCKE